MRKFLLSLACLALAVVSPAKGGEPFEIKDGDRVLFLGDTLLEREGTYGYLETRMAEQFPDRKFTVRNLAFSADTPLGWSRASFDPAAKGFERLKEQLALVKPTVVFLGYGMAASLQEMTDRSQDWTLNRDPARYGAEPMSAARFKKELAQCMDAIVEVSSGVRPDGTAANAAGAARGKDAANPASQNSSSSAAPAASAAVKKSPVRFVLLSPIRHEDLRATRPGLPDPTEHNKLLEQYTKAIEELAKERGARFVDFAAATAPIIPAAPRVGSLRGGPSAPVQTFLTDNGIHLNQYGYSVVVHRPFVSEMGWTYSAWQSELLQSEMKAREIERGFTPESSKRAYELETNARKLLRARDEALRAAIIRKNALFFHRWRPANETYLFGFRKREQGQNAAEIPKFDALIEAAEAEIERLKKGGTAQSAQPATKPASVTNHQSPVTPAAKPPTASANDAPDLSRQTAAEKPDLSKIPAQSSYELPTFTLADGLEISLWAENPLLAKPTEMNWDAQGRLWVASSAMYPMIAPGQAAFDKILVIEDPGHTGKATKSTVFADGLLVPTGVAPVLTPEGHWACYVGQSTELLYFEDTDGTGKADKKRIVLSGFGTEDTHHIVHTLRWGPDGRLYFNQSVYIHTHMETPWGVIRLNSGGVFAYDPRTERVEVFAKGLWNTWGHAWDQWGQSFLTDGAGFTGLSWAFPGATFAPSEGSRRQMASISPGSYPKFAGLELIYSPHFPADWQGTAVTCDFRAHKIVHFKINDLGAGGTAANAAGAAEGKNAANPAPPNSSSSAALAATAAVDSPSGTAANAAGAAREKGAASPAPQSASSSAATAAFAAVPTPKSGYVTEQLPVLAQTSDATFRPIDVKLGPDGALYIADWSNPIINHGEVDFRDPRRDHEHGRIWRLSMKGGAAVKWESLVKATAQALLEKTTSASLWESEQANQVFLQNLASQETETKAGKELDATLRERDASLKLLRAVRLNRTKATPTKDYDAVSKLLLRQDAPNLAAAVVGYIDPSRLKLADHAWSQMQRIIDGVAAQEERDREKKNIEIDARIKTLAELMKKEPAREKEIKKEVDALRDQYEQMIDDWPGLDELLPWTMHSPRRLVSVPNPRLRVMLMRALARTPSIENASLILDTAINAPKDDPQYEFAAWLSINDLAEVWTEAVLAGKWKIEGREKQLEFALDALDAARSGPVIAALLKDRPITRDGAGPWIELIGKGGGKAELAQLYTHIAKGELEPPALARAMNALADAARLRNVRPDGDVAMVTTLIAAIHPDTSAAAARLAGLWKLNEAAPHLEALAKNPDAGQRAAAFEGLRSLGGAPAVTALKKLVRSEAPPVPPAAIAALAQLKPAAAIAEIPAVLGAIKSEPELLATWRGIFQSKEAADLLAKNFPANLPKPAITAALRAARELGRKGDRLVAKLAPLAGESLANVVPADFADLAARAKKDGDPVAGEAMYRRMASACTTCHAIGGAGGKLGPDLTSIGASAPADYIIESILNPAAKVKEGYHAFSFAMKDGTEAIGIPTRETPQEQFIRTVAGELGLPKANIVSKKIAEGGASLMPAGLTAAWGDRERLNLYAFLMELGRPGPFDASKNNVARSWQLTDHIAMKESLELKQNPSAPSGSGGVVEIPVYTLVDGRLTKDLLLEKLAVLQPKNATVHLTARFQVATAGKAKLNLTGIRKAWLDGQPLAIASEPSPSVELTAGAHTFTVEVDAKSPPEVLRLESPAVSFLGD